MSKEAIQGCIWHVRPINSRKLRDSLASPLYGDLAGLRPVRMHVGEDEVLLDDSLRYGERIESQAGTVQIHTWQGMIYLH